MNRRTIQRRFKNIDKKDFNLVLNHSVNILCEYLDKHYDNNSYSKDGIGWSLKQALLNRQYHDKIYTIAVDWIESNILDYDAALQK